ncbi:hypothetical protein ADUPG1_013056 [Aduncisulcus paluster]|uniref:Uncharacterized protein n=1 Tax=Aduncisulcus paluster TaxID=2918883 RepID=A0ABQ5K4U4_9EUKA|nr:hypothetical protein ADUPG1_013056 [Aduncisulcus paluster]
MDEPFQPKYKKASREEIAVSQLQTAYGERDVRKMLNSLGILDIVSREKSKRISLLKIPGYIDLILHTIKNPILPRDTYFEKSERCRKHALSVLINHLLDNPAIDALVLAHEECLPALRAVIQDTATLTKNTLLSVRALDYLCVIGDFRPSIAFCPGLLASICTLISDFSTPRSEYDEKFKEKLRDNPKLPEYDEDILAIIRHCLNICRYLSSDSRLSFATCRCGGILKTLARVVLCDFGESSSSDSSGSSKKLKKDQKGNILSQVQYGDVFSADPQKRMDAQRQLDDIVDGRMKESLREISMDILVSFAAMPANLPELQLSDDVLGTVADILDDEDENTRLKELGEEFLDLVDVDEAEGEEEYEYEEEEDVDQ